MTPRAALCRRAIIFVALEFEIAVTKFYLISLISPAFVNTRYRAGDVAVASMPPLRLEVKCSSDTARGRARRKYRQLSFDMRRRRKQ